MEGANCLTNENKDKLSSNAKNELHDSGCEQSPSTSSPSYKYEQLDSARSSDGFITYDREFLLSLQFHPLCLNPDPKELLWPDHLKYITNNIFNTKKSFYTESDSSSSIERKEMLPDYFKPMLEGTADVLRPQRSSFQSGCKVRTTSSSEAADKPVGPVRAAPAQRRTSESKDRPRSVPTIEKEERAGERRVGSGRIVLERASSRPDSRGQPRPDSKVLYPNRDKTVRTPSHAEKRDNWRSRFEEDDDFAANSPRDRGGREAARGGRDGRSTSSYNNNSYQHRPRQDAEPEWFTEEVSTGDTIELKGFDGHREKIERREKRERDKKDKQERRAAEEKEKAVTDELELVSKKEGTDNIETVTNLETAPNAADDTGQQMELDFPPSLLTEFNFGWLPLSGLSDSGTGTLSTGGSSRASRWFKSSTSQSPTGPLSHKQQDILDCLPGTGGEDLSATDDHMNMLVQGILSAGGPSVSPLTTATSVKPAAPADEGSRILRMLQGSAPPSTKQEKKEPTELPAVLTQLLSTPAAAAVSHSNRPELPKEFKTVEELEAGIQAPKRVTNSSRMYKPSSQHESGVKEALLGKTSTTSDSAPKQEMTAFNKLVDLMKVTGELNKSVPKMPEVTNTESPGHDNKLPDVQTRSNGRMNHKPSAVPVQGFPHLSAQPVPAAHINQQLTQPAGSQPGLMPTLLPHLSHTRTNTPPNAGIPSSLANMASVLPNTALFHNGGAPVGIANMAPAAPVIAATGMHAPAFQGPVNPLLQQTLHQRQKLPSPIMFGTQPPVHIVAPAPIHPMGANQFQPQSSGHPMGMVSTQSNQMMEMVHHSVPVSKPQAAAVSSMAFTPTSVMRKLANDKVDERYRVNDSLQRQTYSNRQQGDGAQSQQHPGTQRQQQLNTQNPLQQPMTMRPIVKNANASNVNEQLLARQLLIEQQSQNQLRQQQAHQMNMVARQHQLQQQQQSQLPPPSTQHQGNHSNLPQHQGNPSNLYQQRGAINHMFHQQQPVHTPQNGHNPANRSTASPLLSMPPQLAFMHSHQQQQQIVNGGNGGTALQGKSSPDILSKFFCSAEFVGSQGLPAIPKHTGMLRVEDIEN